MMGMPEETGTGIVEKPATPRDSEDLLKMLRTRWTDGVFSDVKVSIFDREYCLHRVVLCRSSFFDRLLQGNWNETNDKVLRLEVPSTIITCEAFELSLSHMYANPVILNRNNVLQVIAAASYLGLQDLCAQGAEFVMESLHDPDFFLEFYCRGNLLEYGAHTDTIQKAGWRHLCMMGVDHLRKVLPHLDILTVKRLLQCEELWVETELDRYNLVKEVLFPKLIEARDKCRENLGTAADMPGWMDSSLVSPQEPWVSSQGGLEVSRSKTITGGSGNTNNTTSTQNQLLDSAEIKEESQGVTELQASGGDVKQVQGKLEGVNIDDVNLSSSARGEPGPSSPFPVVDDRSSQGENVSDHRTDEEGLPLEATRDSLEEIQAESKNYQMFPSTQTMGEASVKEATNEVIQVSNAVSDALGLDGIKYSHIHHTDLCKIGKELLELGLHRAYHALLQGRETQDILYKRIEACSFHEEQEQQSGRMPTYPKNLHPCSPKDIEDLHSGWILPSFRFGVEFADVKNIAPQTEQISESHYYAGSVWKVRLLIDDTKNEVRLHLFRNQRRIGRIGGLHTPYDAREVVCTRFKFLIPSREGMAARSSRPGRFQQKKGRGWNDFLRLDNIEGYLTPWGSLRVIVVVYPPFESD